MSSSRPSDTGHLDDTDLPDPADLPEDDGSSVADLFPDGIGFSDADDHDATTYAVSPGRASAAPAGSAASSETAEPSGSADSPSLRQRWNAARQSVRPWSAWTLRAKLVASMLVLFTLLSLLTGAFTVVALQRQLLGQVDDQLNTSITQMAASRRPIDLSGDEGEDNGPRGPGDEGLAAYFPTKGTSDIPSPRGAATSDAHRRTSLTTAQLDQIQAAGISPDARTVTIEGLGPYRVLSAYQPLVNPGTGARTNGALVIGLPVEQQQRTIQRMIVLALSTAGAGIILVAVLGTWLVRRNLEPLRRVAATATKVSRMPLHSGKVALAERVDPVDTDTRTEVGQVGAAFNEMLDHVDEALNARHQSEQRVRQFVADASHELRTPLASIKGYAELSRREPNAVPQTVTHAMGRIESEANRMSSLVEDLLLLARLDAGRPLDDAPVDMSMLVINAVSDAHAASPGHRWDLDLPPEPVEVTGDSARLHQVVANLLANARTHTPDGTRVTTSVRPEGDWVRVAVHDDGPGVPESLQPNVFERFARGDDARVRANGSTGLGLSIVAAVSKAHGGRVELDSRPGDTTFSLLLPAAP
ncbi:HAMP domain-containing sensor histidine kinase [Terrabacter ginsenosidimutans]|uniref:histidine kinase n=1 Tax=Terrabacter ginsenosidimutans TaxID=490575 RepID=A0ABP7CQR7_9MICO